MRGQRPALASLLAWVAMLALLLGSLPLLAPSSDGHAASALLQSPLEERGGGGEGSLHEQAPAKLRRVALKADVPLQASMPDTALVPLAACWVALAQPAAGIDFQSRDWRDASMQPPRADPPGRRQQRGQAPPLA
ncbi:hypothetical protein [Stenotrophomonas tumulicola]|uniref:Uncharacterized protein n=1 Tax=Stenotrophomonas tumulicola TaxID=1685415 RepID=A0A7W3IHF6_9GAMM|nr:hypothetical protein [Stenotrophomonas tumulicola]MBA8681832.1 hypothetical protein [Stenotrophomonas tumulicola]